MQNDRSGYTTLRENAFGKNYKISLEIIKKTQNQEKLVYLLVDDE